MTQWNEADDFLMGAGGKSATFKVHGDAVDGYVTHAERRQQTDFKTKALKFYDDGNPMWQLVVTLQTEDREDDEDDGLRKVYIRGQLTKAVQDAVRKAGEKGLREGGRLYVRYTGDAEPVGNLDGAKQYFAKYLAPTVAVEPNGASEYESDTDDSPF